jgi:hypothetical protein
MRWTEPVERVGRIEMPTTFIWGNVKERDSSENSRLDEKIILHERCDWIHLVLDKDRLL